MTPTLAEELTKTCVDLLSRVRAIEAQINGATPMPPPERFRPSHLAIHDLIRQAAIQFEAMPSEIIGRSAAAAHVRPRQWVMFEAHLIGKSSTEIGRALNRDHSTVLHGVRREAERRAVQG